jgi:hypothetical protein
MNEHELATFLDNNLNDYINRRGDVWFDGEKNFIFTGFLLEYWDIITKDMSKREIKKLKSSIDFVISFMKKLK